MALAQVSSVVHRLPSSHGVVRSWNTQPIWGSQLAILHSLPVQTRGGPGTHTPALQLSPSVQASPSSQGAPSEQSIPSPMASVPEASAPELSEPCESPTSLSEPLTSSLASPLPIASPDPASAAFVPSPWPAVSTATASTNVITEEPWSLAPKQPCSSRAAALSKISETRSLANRSIQ
ncbi:MAG: hypothetical protein RIT45_3630 [Pseudomonadota bacterium]